MSRGHDAIRQDAEIRVDELRAVAQALWHDRDDASVLCELHSVLSQLRAAQTALGDLNASRGER